MTEYFAQKNSPFIGTVARMSLPVEHVTLIWLILNPWRLLACSINEFLVLCLSRFWKTTSSKTRLTEESKMRPLLRRYLLEYELIWNIVLFIDRLPWNVWEIEPPAVLAMLSLNKLSNILTFNEEDMKIVPPQPPLCLFLDSARLCSKVTFFMFNDLRPKIAPPNPALFLLKEESIIFKLIVSMALPANGLLLLINSVSLTVN